MQKSRSGYHPHICGKERYGTVLVIFLVLVLMTGICGCVRLMQQSVDNGTVSLTQPGVLQASAHGAAVATARPAPSATTGSGLQVYSAAPDVTPDPYPVQHGTRVNATVLASRYVTPSFTRTYTLGGAPVGLGVNVTKGPFLIYFTIHPKYDCLNDPESCRGTGLVPVNRPYCTITVTDNQTHQIVAQDGYAREFSSNTTNRSVTIYGAGQYLITIDGNYLDITLSLASGDPTPVPTAAPAGRTATPARRPPGPWGAGT